MKLQGKCIICKKDGELVGIGTFAKFCAQCQNELHQRDLKTLESYKLHPFIIRAFKEYGAK